MYGNDNWKFAEKYFREADYCYICLEKYTKNEPGIMDYCPFTYTYRGSAHKNCSLKFKKVLHKIASFDSKHLKITENDFILGKIEEEFGKSVVRKTNF